MTKPQTTPIEKSWQDHERDNGKGCCKQSYEAGWNDALEAAARSFLIGEKILELQGDL